MDGKIYIGQTWLKLRGVADVDLDACQEVKMEYRKPDGTEGQWEVDLLADNRTIEYQIESKDILDIAGTWTYWGYFVDQNGKEGYTYPEDFEVYKRGY